MYPLSVAALLLTLASVFGFILPVFWLHAKNPHRFAGAVVLTWSGLRGGISVALALSLPPSEWRNDILVVCYAVVIFTIIVQGLSIERVIGWVSAAKPLQPIRPEATRTARRSLMANAIWL